MRVCVCVCVCSCARKHVHVDMFPTNMYSMCVCAIRKDSKQRNTKQLHNDTRLYIQTYIHKGVHK